ncbi:hypothetical protein BaRGS_00027967 [Batillaria attramentaria]|uniref:Uncharacterized protein n=1 Tax=Batillaria attramentaria TaxID=370345 RepID=A0ABD0K0C7_9CAEN
MDEASSDTSGETGTSDSGRGGSEDDVNIEHILHGDHDRHAAGRGPSLSPSPAPVAESHYQNHSRFPPPSGPRGGRDGHKALHVRFNTPSSTGSPSQSRGSFSTNQKNVSFSSPTVRDSPIFTPTKSRETFSSPNFRDISFSSLSQQEQSPRVLSTFSSPRPVSFTFQKPRGNSAASVDDDASTTTSGSYTVNPEEIRMENYIGSDVIV